MIFIKFSATLYLEMHTEQPIRLFILPTSLSSHINLKWLKNSKLH